MTVPLATAPAVPAPARVARVRRVTSAPVLALSGDVGPGTEEAWAGSLATALKGCPSIVVADLGEARLGPASVPVLRWLHAEIITAGARFGVAGLSSEGREALEAAHLDPPPIIYPALPAAPPWSDGGRVQFL